MWENKEEYQLFWSSFVFVRRAYSDLRLQFYILHNFVLKTTRPIITI